MFPLVISCSVVPQIKINLNDPDERLRQYRESIYRWAESGVFSEIVIVDNSNTEILSRQEVQHLLTKGIVVEQIKFGPEDEVAERGASWGQARIYQQALDESSLIRRSNFFATTTGRTFVANVKDLLADFDANSDFTYVNEWLSKGYKQFTPGRADLRFLIWNKPFFTKEIAPLQDELDDSKNQWIEHVYHAVFKNNSTKIKSFRNNPRVVGQSGHGGGFYDGTYYFRWFFKNILAKLSGAGRY